MTEHAELELAQRYAASTLGAEELDAFEAHLLTCAVCQTEVRLSAGLRRLFREDAVGAQRRGRWIAGGAALLAAGIAALIILPNRVDRKISALGIVKEPPAYIGLTVRALPEQGDSLFAAAMTAYNARDYEAAARDLAAALNAGVDSIATEFFLASAQLMADKPREAVEHYSRVIGAGPLAASYLEEARLYRARALLRLGREQEALADLGAVGDTDPALSRVARALADSVRLVGKR